MENTQPKHMKSFWPLTIIFFLAVIAAGLIFWYTYHTSLQEDVDSLQTAPHKDTVPTATKASVKTPVNK